MLDLQTATSPEVQAALEKGAVCVLAVGAQEQHGAHLPLTTDTIQESARLARLFLARGNSRATS